MTSSTKNKPGTPFPPDAKHILNYSNTPPIKCCPRKRKINNEKNIGRRTTKKISL